jgi:hypothetical protein
MLSGLVLSGIAFAAFVPEVKAVTVTDNFEFRGATKEWCEDNPKFFENISIRIDSKDPSNNITLTFTRDADGIGDTVDVQAKLINTGSSDIDAITLSGLAFPANTAGRKLEFALSGVNPGNDDHFLTVRGQASLDKLSNVTKLTGTFVYQIIGTYTVNKETGQQSGPVECFASGTFTTGKKL